MEQKTNEQKSRAERMNEREERIQKRNAIIERKVERAKQIDTQVIETKSEDVGTMVNLLVQTDIALIRIRKHIGGRVPLEPAMEIIKRFEDAMLIIQDITTDAMKLTNSKYAQPRGIKAIEERRNQNMEKNSD